MEYYYKGKNVDEPWDKSRIPIPGLPEEFIWMHVNCGSKMRNLLGYAINEFNSDTYKAIVWSGSGNAVSKTISCAEIIKRRYKEIYQINKICYRRNEEHWEPLMKDLDPLVVVREVPTIHILLSKEPLNESEPGYQCLSGPCVSAKKGTPNQRTKTSQNYQPKPRTQRAPCLLGEFAPTGMSTSQKRKKNSNDR